MHKEAAARITRRSVESLEKLGKTIAPLSYDVRDFAKLGLLRELLQHLGSGRRLARSETAPEDCQSILPTRPYRS